MKTKKQIKEEIKELVKNIINKIKLLDFNTKLEIVFVLSIFVVLCCITFVAVKERLFVLALDVVIK